MPLEELEGTLEQQSQLLREELQIEGHSWKVLIMNLEQAVRNAQLGDKNALERVVEQIQDLIYRVTLRMLSHPRTQEASEILGINPAALRKQLSRARSDLVGFMKAKCGLVHDFINPLTNFEARSTSATPQTHHFSGMPVYQELANLPAVALQTKSTTATAFR